MSPWNTRVRWLRNGGAGVFAFLAASGCAMGPEDFGPQVTSSAVSQGSAITQFRDVLSPYGTWMDLPDVGWVWRPSTDVVGADFVPYATGGRWVSSDWGWTFETSWNWGWAPFHYGRWFNRPAEGWVWWPDDEWAPSWVDWRWGDGYVGWQPLAPPGLSIGLAWTFVGTDDFLRPEVGHYLVPRDRTQVLLRQTQPVGEYVVARHGQWNRGPEPSEVARVTGRLIPLAEPMTPPTSHPPRARTGPVTPRPTTSVPAAPRPTTVAPAAPHEPAEARPEAAQPHEPAAPRSEPAPHEHTEQPHSGAAHPGGSLHGK